MLQVGGSGSITVTPKPTIKPEPVYSDWFDHCFCAIISPTSPVMKLLCDKFYVPRSRWHARMVTSIVTTGQKMTNARRILNGIFQMSPCPISLSFLKLPESLLLQPGQFIVLLRKHHCLTLSLSLSGCWSAVLFHAISARTNVTTTMSIARLPNHLVILKHISWIILMVLKFNTLLKQLLQDWAKLGECKKNPDYMNIYCSKVYSINQSENQHNNNETLQSCKKCSGGCEDENKSCAQWAKKVTLLSFILTVGVFIMVQIFYSCRQRQQFNRDNANVFQGYCKSGEYTNYMKLRCKASCKLCWLRSTLWKF